MYNFAVCDDEKETAGEISKKLHNYFNEKINISEFYGGIALINSEINYDAIFLDVKMPAPDGMETARLLRKSGFDGIIIFITILEDYVYDSFEVSAFDYIVKPVNEEKLLRTLSRLDKKLTDKNRTLVIRNGDKKRIIPINDIIYCEVLNRQIFIHTISGETIDFYGKIKSLEDTLCGENFFKCHRSYIVDLRRVSDFSSTEIHMSDGSRIPVSRLRKDEFEQALIKQMRG